jgi:hypothetical protein
VVAATVLLSIVLPEFEFVFILLTKITNMYPKAMLSTDLNLSLPMFYGASLS